MAYANGIPDAFRKEFADNFRDVVQQKDSRLMKTVAVERGLSGIGKQIQFVDPIRSEKTTGQRYRKTRLQDLNVDGRWYFPDSFTATTGEDSFDEKKLAPTIMGNGKHITAHQRAFLLDCDEVIINALTGVAYTGKNGTDQTELPDSQIVPVDYVYTGSDTDSGMTAPKLIEAVRILTKNEAWNDDVANEGQMLWSVIDADIAAALKQQANLASGDRLFSNEFGGPPEYDEKGFIRRWGAVNFVMYNSLLTDTVVGSSGSDNVSAKIVPVYTSTAVEFGIWQDLVSRVSERDDIEYAIQFFSKYMIGAGREQEKKVVRINCKA